MGCKANSEIIGNENRARCTLYAYQIYKYKRLQTDNRHTHEAHTQNRRREKTPKCSELNRNRKREMKTNLCVYDSTALSPMALSQKQRSNGYICSRCDTCCAERTSKWIERHFCFVVIIMSAIDLDPDLRYTHAYATTAHTLLRAACTRLNIEC